MSLVKKVSKDIKMYSIVPAVGDVRLNVRGESLEKLFATALEGMNRIMNKEYEKHLNRHVFVKEIKLASIDTTSLLIDFLSEILALSHINKAIFYTIDNLEIYDNSLHAVVLGVKSDKFDKDIKAVAYHETNVKQNDKGDYKTTIVFKK